MEVVIEGMKIPKCCFDCPLSYEHDFVEYCKVNDMRIERDVVGSSVIPVNIYSTRHPKCPLREID